MQQDINYELKPRFQGIMNVSGVAPAKLVILSVSVVGCTGTFV